MEESQNQAHNSAPGSPSAPRTAGVIHNYLGTRHPFRVPGYACVEALAPSERQFQAAVLEYAELVGWRCYHTRASRRSRAGFPDLTMVRCDRLVFAELKTNRGRVPTEQAAWLDALARCGAVETDLWRPIDWSTIERVLR